MGTNFYFMSRDKELVRNYFAEVNELSVYNAEYDIVDEPYLGYEIHLNKLSCGWRPLFQRHKAFNTFKELEDFYHANCEELEIFDEYCEQYSWEKYFDRVLKHSLREPMPVKWTYGSDKIMGEVGPYLQIERCSEEEADLFAPYNHKEYSETQQIVHKQLRVYEPYRSSVKYWNDPDYLFDWTEGEFS